MILLEKLRTEKFFQSYDILSSYSGLQQKLLWLENTEYVGVRSVHLWTKPPTTCMLRFLPLSIMCHPLYFPYKLDMLRYVWSTVWQQGQLGHLHPNAHCMLHCQSVWLQTLDGRSYKVPLRLGDLFLLKYILYFSIFFSEALLKNKTKQNKTNSGSDPLRCHHFDLQLYFHPDLIVSFLLLAYKHLFILFL